MSAHGSKGQTECCSALADMRLVGCLALGMYSSSSHQNRSESLLCETLQIILWRGDHDFDVLHGTLNHVFSL